MKLEDCKIGMKVCLGLGLIHNTSKTISECYPDRIGVISRIGKNLKAPIFVMPDGWWFRLDQIEPYIEPEETEYRQLQDITPRAIFEEDCSRLEITPQACFMQEFIRFVQMFDLEYEDSLSFSDLTWELENEPEWTTWLTQRGFIEKVVEEKLEEVTYAVGDRFTNSDEEEYLLAQPDAYTVFLVSLENGNRWTGPHRVSSSKAITEAEFHKIAGHDNFTKIEGK